MLKYSRWFIAVGLIIAFITSAAWAYQEKAPVATGARWQLFNGRDNFTYIETKEHTFLLDTHTGSVYKVVFGAKDSEGKGVTGLFPVGKP